MGLVGKIFFFTSRSCCILEKKELRVLHKHTTVTLGCGKRSKSNFLIKLECCCTYQIEANTLPKSYTYLTSQVVLNVNEIVQFQVKLTDITELGL